MSSEKNKKSRPFIGGHVSVSGGFTKGIDNAEAIGAEAIQFFGASPQQWAAKLPSEKDAEAFRTRREKSNVERAYLHAAYLVNLASPDDVMRMKSLANLTTHFKIAHLLGADGLIFHLGSGKEMPREEAIKWQIGAIKGILKDVPNETQLVMENSAGGGQKIGSNPEEMGIIMSAVNSPRLKICYDTAHAFEAGIIDEYSPAKIKELFDKWDKEVGLENIVALHVNDSKTPYNSHHDRHENIGEGHIGLKGFQNLAKEKRLNHTAWLLEVPGFEGMGPDKKNVDILKNLF